MNCATRFAFALLAASAVALPRAARADSPNSKASPVYVLTLSTDDSDDQADALTQAMRWRVRQAPGWSLLETPQSMDTLAIALKCPPKPDGPCLQRIGDQLHADHFVWGGLSKGKPGEVKADLHMWTRGKPDVEAVDTYSDNLKDASDESLRGITASLFGKLSGAPVNANGTLVVHAGAGGGEVLVDGTQRGTLEAGLARITVPVGPHTVTVRVPGSEAAPQNATVIAGGNRDLVFTLGPETAAPVDEGPHSSFPIRKVLAYSALVVGAGLLIASGVETAQWISDGNASNNDLTQIPTNLANGTKTDVCLGNVPPSNAVVAQDACQKSKDATKASALGWILGGVGAALVGTGVVLLVTDHPAETGGATAANRGASHKPSIDVIPSLGPQGGGMSLRIAF